MSRGPGRHQKDILDAVAEHPEGVFVTEPEMATSDKAARRRAAHQLATAGRIQLTAETIRNPDGRPVTHLIAWPLGVETPASHVQKRGNQKVVLPGSEIALTNAMIAAMSGSSVSTVKRDRAELRAGEDMGGTSPHEVDPRIDHIVQNVRDAVASLYETD